MSILWGLENIETGSTPWSFTSVGNIFGTATATVDTSSKVNGANSIKFSNTGEAGCAAIKDMGSGYSDIRFKFAGFIPTAFTFGASAYLNLMQFQSSADASLVELNLEDWGSIELVLNGDVLGYLDTGLTIPKNSVFTLEVQVIKNATTGRVKIWLNSNVEGSPTYDSGDKNTGTTQIQKFSIGKPYVPDTCGDYYLDDFTIADTFIGAGLTPTLEQEGYKWFNDDGNESSATAIENQDIPTTRNKNLNTRLRVLINGTYDPATTPLQLEYRKKNYGNKWKKVLGTADSPAHVLAGTPVEFTGNAVQLDQDYDCKKATVLVLTIVSDGAAAAALRTGGAPNYGGRLMTQGNSTRGGATSYETSCELWYLIDPPEGLQTCSIPNTRPNVLHAVLSSYKAGEGYTSALDDNDGTAATTGANPTVTSTPTVNGAVIVGVLGSGRSSLPSAQTGTLLFATLTGATRNACHQYKLQATAAGFAVTWTLATDDWCVVACAFKPVAITQKITLGASANITASGENTSARLTAPSGKSTSDFTAGRIQDDENPTDTIDIGDGKYTEVEFSIKAEDTA